MFLQRRRARRAAAVAAAALSISLVTTPALSAPNPNSPEKLAKAVTAGNTMQHLAEFQRIADANDGNRASGTSGYEDSAQYVEQTLRAAGYATIRQRFSFDYWRIDGETSLVRNSPEPGPIPDVVMEYSPSTPETGATGDLTAPVTATGCSDAEWNGVNATGSIALVSRGGCTFAQKSIAAGQAGAVAVIIYNNPANSTTGDEALNGTLGGLNAAHIPTTGVTLNAGNALLAQMAEGTVNVTFQLQADSEVRETFNVLAETRTGRADNVVMLGAHLDSVAEGPGINDNGSGSAAILEVAVQLGGVNKVNNKVRFVWWGAEENGLLGSSHYVNDLVDNNPTELANIAGYLNFDMVASPNYIIGVYDADQSTYEAPVPVPAGSAELERIFTDYFDRIDQPWVDTEFSGRSDYDAFIRNGIPASGLFTGADGTKTAAEVALFGGTEGTLYDPNYHRPGDDITNVDETALGINVKAIAYATGTLAYDTSVVNGKASRGKSGKPTRVAPKTEIFRPAA